jgi:flagellar biosynthetic protein FlhB
MAAEAETGGERTEEPSAKRLQDARERGQVPRSRELVTFASMIAGSGALVALGGPLAASMSQLMRSGLAIDPRALRDPDAMSSSLGQACLQAMTILLPLFGALIGLIVLASVALGGWNFSLQAMTADFSRLNPLAGLQRLLGMRGVSELGKALLKCIVVGAVCAAIVAWIFGDVLALGHMTPRAAISRGAALAGWAFVWLCASLALIAVVDVPLQLFQFKRALRMTRQELRDEAKESDGRPETKQRIRRLQQQSARQRMMKEVPTADVIIVNPTHFAVALKYDPKSMRAPRLVAKGVDLVAQNIRRIAAEHRVPVFGAPKLARALYRSTDLNREIPSGLYVAVAQVLSYIFRVRTLNPTLAARVVRPVPDVGEEYGDV